MRYNPHRAADDWILLEIVIGDKRPCSDAYERANDDDLVQIFGELRLLQAAGCPPDQLKGNPEVESWKDNCKGDHHKTQFFVLKAKPSGWRLYFIVLSSERREIVFLYAVNKKRHERNQEDFQRLCRTRAKLVSGDPRIATERIDIPPR